MLNGNEYEGMKISPVNKETDLAGAVRTADELIEEKAVVMDVEPPTKESLQTSVRTGIEVGRELQRRGFGKVAVDQALVMVKVRQFESWIFSENAIAFGHAAIEAYVASGFRYLPTDFENPESPEFPYVTFVESLK